MGAHGPTRMAMRAATRTHRVGVAPLGGDLRVHHDLDAPRAQRGLGAAGHQVACRGRQKAGHRSRCDDELLVHAASRVPACIPSPGTDGPNPPMPSSAGTTGTCQVCELTPPHPSPLCTPPALTCAQQRDGHDRHARLDRHAEGALLEARHHTALPHGCDASGHVCFCWPEVACTHPSTPCTRKAHASTGDAPCLGARALGEEQHGRALAQQHTARLVTRMVGEVWWVSNSHALGGLLCMLLCVHSHLVKLMCTQVALRLLVFCKLAGRPMSNPHPPLTLRHSSWERRSTRLIMTWPVEKDGKATWCKP